MKDDEAADVDETSGKADLILELLSAAVSLLPRSSSLTSLCDVDGFWSSRTVGVSLVLEAAAAAADVEGVGAAAASVGTGTGGRLDTTI